VVRKVVIGNYKFAALCADANTARYGRVSVGLFGSITNYKDYFTDQSEEGWRTSAIHGLHGILRDALEIEDNRPTPGAVEFEARLEPEEGFYSAYGIYLTIGAGPHCEG
jgi:hypothetical protein